MLSDDEDAGVGRDVTSEGGLEVILDESSSAVVPCLSVTSRICCNSVGVRLLVGDAIVV
jgi:hypothetical protein